MQPRHLALAIVLVAAALAAWGFSVGSVIPATPLGALAAAGGQQRSPQLIATPGPLVAVWKDVRDRYPRVYASRLDPSTLDALDGPGGVEVGDTFGSGQGFAAAFGGVSSGSSPGAVLVVWPNGGLDGRRLFGDGGMSADFPVAGSNAADMPALASDGDAYLLAWVDSSGVSQPRVVATPLNGLGQPMTVTTPMSVSGALREGSWPRVAFSKGRYVLVWMEGGTNATEVLVRDYTATGGLGSARALSSGGAIGEYPEVVALPDGGAFAAWYERSNSGRRLVGGDVDSPGFLVITPDAGAPPWFGLTEGRPALSTSPTSTVLYVAWSGTDLPAFTDRVSFAVTSPPFAAVSFQVTRQSVLASDPTLAPAGSGVYAAYTDCTNCYWDWDVEASDVTVEQLGASLPTLRRQAAFARAYTEQREPVLATSSTTTAGAWVEYHLDGGNDLMAGKLGAGGFMTPQLVAGGPTYQVAPTLTGSDAEIFLLAWTDLDLRQVRAVRLDANANALAPELVVASGLGTIPDYPCAAYGDGIFYVAWSDGDHVFARRYRLTGASVDPAPLQLCVNCINNGRPYFERLACAYGGEGFLVAWADGRALNQSRQMVFARVLADGGQPDPGGSFITITSEEPAHPAAAWDGQQFVVAWHEHRPNLVFGGVSGARVRGGMVLDPDGRRLEAPTGGGEQQFPALTPVPGGLLLAWADDDAALVRAQHLVDGAPTGPVVTLTAGERVQGVAATALPQRSVVLISRPVDAELGAVRLELVSVDRDPLGSTCSFSFDCASGACDGGVCVGPSSGAGGGGTGGGSAGGAAGSTAGGAGGGDAGGAAGGSAGGLEPDRKLGVGCGCGSSDGLFMLLLAVVLRRRVRCRA